MFQAEKHLHGNVVTVIIPTRMMAGKTFRGNSRVNRDVGSIFYNPDRVVSLIKIR